jgi:threonine synthase
MELPVHDRWNMLVRNDQPGIWRFRGLLPVEEHVVPVSLGEGNTPLITAGRFGQSLGAPAIFFKLESANPTWSHKDRLASLGVSIALSQGAEAVILASSGNQGAAAAAYCARAGLPCIVLTTAEIPPVMKLMIQSYGGMVVLVPTADDRRTVMVESLEQENWFPLSGYADPPLGSHPAAVGAYSSIAFELFEQSNGRLPDSVVVPTAHGDTLAGMWSGFRLLKDLFQLDTLPRLIAVEPFGSLERTVEAGAETPLPGQDGSTRATSIAARVSTPQALAAVRESGGTGVRIDDEEMRVAHLQLAREGLFVEPSSAMAAAALPTLLAREIIGADERTVVLISSSGLKDPGYAADSARTSASISADPGQLLAALRRSYGFRAD